MIPLAFVALLAFSPVGEELIAIPAGAAMGLPLELVVPVAAVANFLPVPVILLLFDLAHRHPRLHRWLVNRRRERIVRWMDRYGVLGVIAITPWVGVYATTVTCELLGMDRYRLVASVIVSLTAYALALGILIGTGMELL
ncbi:MAG: small multi-drug export protein [Methanomassiliicoccales archaeon]